MREYISHCFRVDRDDLPNIYYIHNVLLVQNEITVLEDYGKGQRNVPRIGKDS